MSSTLRDLGIEIQPEEDSPLVRKLVAVIEQLVARIHQLEGLPTLPKREPAPSPLKDDSAPPSKQQTNQKSDENSKPKKRKPPRRRTGPRRPKFKDLAIDETKVLRPDAIPDGAKFLGYKSFIQQELQFDVVNIRYRRARYQLADGSIAIAPRPDHLKGHYGPKLRCFILYQYFQNQVTQPLILQQLNEFGIKMSTGQLSRMLTEGHDQFHQEKDALLPAAREVSEYFQNDDTTARHLGKNGHTLHIGNDLFATFFTSMSKSRINFLKILQMPYHDYVLGKDALAYLEYYDLPKKLREQLAADLKGKTWIWEDTQQWDRQLGEWGITNEEHRRIVTESGLWGSLMEHELYVDQPMLSDGAAQFKLFGFAHGLCWLHAERVVARLIPLTKREQRAYDKARDSIWHYYQRLKAYRDVPTEQKKQRLEKRFDELFLAETGWEALNAAMLKIHGKKTELVLVLEHPELPLHNNLSENDIRQFAKLRKISGSTRSDSGLRARDTFISLKTTCRKLGLSFWQYLQDRINGLNLIPSLSEIIRGKAAKSTT